MKTSDDRARCEGPAMPQMAGAMNLFAHPMAAAAASGAVGLGVASHALGLDDQLGFSGRIARDDWAGQAKRLLGA